MVIANFRQIPGGSDPWRLVQSADIEVTDVRMDRSPSIHSFILQVLIIID